MSGSGEILLFQTEEGAPQIQVTLEGNSVWLSQVQLAELYQTERSVITKHINNIYESEELGREGTCAKIAQVQIEGSRQVNRPVEFYNLDVIISVGYRVNARRGVQFRIWATNALREYMVKGFVLDDERLSGQKKNYFDELLERVRRIRTSEANFYEKVRDIFATSIDYNSKDEIATTFFKTVQNKFHYAITGQTAAEIIVTRVNAYKDNMGVVTKKGKRVTKQEALVAKNYLEELELKRLELLVDQFLSFAELQSIEQRAMYMKDWIRKLDEFIRLNDKKVLTNAGTVSHKYMEQIVGEEYEVYARKLLEEGEASGDFTKADFENALRKLTRPDN